MKVIFINLLLLSFLGISVLAFVTMNHDSSYGDKNCAAEMATGVNCPINPLAFADFHLNLFRGFSSAHLGEFVNMFLALVAFLLAGLFLGLFVGNYLAIARVNYRPEQFLRTFIPLSKTKACHWLSLHENSPSVL